MGIVDELRQGIGTIENVPAAEALMDRAADEIARLRAELERAKHHSTARQEAADFYRRMVDKLRSENERLRAALNGIFEILPATHLTGWQGKCLHDIRTIVEGAIEQSTHVVGGISHTGEAATCTICHSHEQQANDLGQSRRAYKNDIVG